MPQPRPTLAQLVEDERDELDQLCAELAQGVRSSQHFDELEAKATRISRGLRDAFRVGSVT